MSQFEEWFEVNNSRTYSWSLNISHQLALQCRNDQGKLKFLLSEHLFSRPCIGNKYLTAYLWFLFISRSFSATSEHGQAIPITMTESRLNARTTQQAACASAEGWDFFLNETLSLSAFCLFTQSVCCYISNRLGRLRGNQLSSSSSHWKRGSCFPLTETFSNRCLRNLVCLCFHGS